MSGTDYTCWRCGATIVERESTREEIGCLQADGIAANVTLNQLRADLAAMTAERDEALSHLATQDEADDAVPWATFRRVVGERDALKAAAHFAPECCAAVIAASAREQSPGKSDDMIVAEAVAGNAMVTDQMLTLGRELAEAKATIAEIETSETRAAWTEVKQERDKAEAAHAESERALNEAWKESDELRARLAEAEAAAGAIVPPEVRDRFFEKVLKTEYRALLAKLDRYEKALRFNAREWDGGETATAALSPPAPTVEPPRCPHGNIAKPGFLCGGCAADDAPTVAVLASADKDADNG